MLPFSPTKGQLASLFRRLWLAGLLCGASGVPGFLPAPAAAQKPAPPANSAVCTYVRQLPALVPGQRPVHVSPALPTMPGLVAAPVPAAPRSPSQESEDEIETRTLLAGEAQRRPGEADSTFVRRVLPLSFAESHDLLAAAWRPSAYGKQLFFSRPSPSEFNEQGSDLVVLDPFYENGYAVHIFPIRALAVPVIPSQGTATTLTAIFFADVNQDGQKELLALSQGGVLEPEGFTTHYQTQVFHYLGPTSMGHPQYYEDDTQRQSLAELATVAEVRQALARSQPPRPVPKRASPSKPPKK